MSAPPAPIPPFIDHIALLRDLQSWGWRPYKLEAACGLTVGHVAYLQKHPEANLRMDYPKLARIYNLWCDELARRGGYESTHSFGLTALSA